MAAAAGFAQIISTHDLERTLYQGAVSFPDYQTRVLRRIGCSDLDEIFVCRNMQALNGAVLHGFPKARKVCFGDGLGVIDLNADTPDFPPFLQSGHPQVDEIICTAPLETTSGVLSRLPLTIVPPDCFIQTVGFVLRHVQTAPWLALWNGLRAAQNSVFVCLANLTESSIVATIDHELELYVNCVRALVDRKRSIILKGHPRQLFRQAELLASRLQSIGYAAHCVPNGHLTPVEFLAPFLPVSLLIPLLSSSGTTWRLLRPETPIFGGTQPDLLQRFLMPDARENDLSLIWTGENTVSITLATQRRFPPICRRAIREHLSLLPSAPIRFAGEGETDASSEEEKRKINQAAEFVEHVVLTSKEMLTPLPPKTQNNPVSNRVSKFYDSLK
jgi:hypothetical protein